MKRLFLIVLLLSVPAFAGHAHYSASIIQAPTSELEVAMIGQATPDNVWGIVADVDPCIWVTGDTNYVLIRWNKFIDTIRAVQARYPTGTVTIDSAVISVMIYDPVEDGDSCRLGIRRLVSGQGAASRHFYRGNGDMFADPDSGGVTWNMCVDSVKSGWLHDLAWTTVGGRGVGDTVGGLIAESRWITHADTPYTSITITLTGESIAASFDSSTAAKDMTDARYPGWLINVSTLYDHDADYGGVTLCSGGWWSENYCNFAASIPSITLYVTNEWTGLRSIGLRGGSIGRPLESIGR